MGGAIRLVAMSSVMLFACGDNDAHVVDAGFDVGPTVCDQQLVANGPAGCFAAQLFAARGILGLVPSQAEIDRYLDRWSRVIEREPILRDRHPQMYRESPPTRLDVSTTNAAVISAWTIQQLATGDAAFDETMAFLDPIDINPFFSNSGGPGTPFLFLVRVRRIHNEESLERELARTDSHLPDPQTFDQDDGTWTWAAGPDGDIAQIDFSFVWGDCFEGCLGSHHLRAIAPPIGDAQVYDLGGDPLPDGLHLSATTIPP